MNIKKSFLQKVIQQPTEGRQNIVVCHKTLTSDRHRVFAAMFVEFTMAKWNVHILFDKPSQAKDFPKIGVVHSYLFPSDTVPTMTEHVSDLLKVEVNIDIFLNSPTPEVQTQSRRVHWGIPPDNDTLQALENICYGNSKKELKSTTTLEDLAERGAVKGLKDF